MEEPSLFDNHLGPSNGAVTSWLASLDNALRNGGQRLRVLRAYDQWGAMTDEQAQERLSMSPNAQRPRRGELAALDLIEECGFGKTRAGNRAIRWAMTDKGREVLDHRRAVERAS